MNDEKELFRSPIGEVDESESSDIRHGGIEIKVEGTFDDDSPLKKTIAEIKTLKEWDGQVLFLFGRKQIGKSSILGSLLYFMGTQESKGRVVPMNIIPEGYAFYNKSVQALSKQKLPGRTTDVKPICACVEFTPTRSENPPLRLAVLEIRGEDLEKVQTETGMMGELREDINLFLSVEDFKIGFVLVTSHDNASQDDNLMADFINYLLNLPRKFPMSRVLLLISKWDTYRGTRSPEDFVRSTMPLTYGALISRDGAVGTYSVGTVTNLEKEPYISQLDTESPRRLFRWVYQHFTGIDLYALSWWKKLLSKVQ